MKINSKKIAASTVAVAMMMTVAACDKSGEEVLSAAESYASNICNMKASKITAAVSNVKSDRADMLAEAIENINDDAILSTIAGTLAYEIDEDSLESSSRSGEGSVDVVFTYVDSDSVYEDVFADGGDEDDFIAALEDSDDVVEVEITLEFVLEDGEWLVDDSKLSQLEEIYGFIGSEYEFAPALTPEMVSESSHWYYTISDNTYGATDEIEYDIIPYDDYLDIEWNFYYEIYFNGSLVYTSDELVDSGYWIEAYYGPNQGATLTPDGYLPEGEYEVIIYAVNGDITLDDAICTVGSTNSASGDMIDRVEWYYSDDGVYTDAYSIELDIIPTSEGEEVEWNFYYEYYINGDLVFTSDACTDMGHWIEAYYSSAYVDEIAYDSTGVYLAPGYYRCVMYAMDGTVLADETCMVVSSADGAPDSSSITVDQWTDGVEDYWYSYSDGTGYAMEEGHYSVSESIIEYTCEVMDEELLSDFPVYYEVFYVEDENANLDQLEEVYRAIITPTEYSNGYFYEFRYEGELQTGVYFILGAADPEGNTILFAAEAFVS